MTFCYLCGSEDRQRRPGRVRDNPTQAIWQCAACGLVYLERETVRGSEFYVESGMHGDAPPDPAAWLRDGERDDGRRVEFLGGKLNGRRILDFGCGAGGFLAKARRVAATVEGVEPERRLTEHFRSLELSVYGSLDELSPARQYDLITAFHVVEHLPDPREVLRELAAHLSSGGELIVEVPSANDALLTLYGNRAFSEFTYWSCHLYLFDAMTLRRLGEQAGLKVNFVRHVQRYPLSNHLHWLANGRPGGHQIWSFVDSPELNRAYEASLAAAGLSDTLIAGFSCP